MTPLTVHEGIAAPLLRLNIDTDAIIPSREMKRVSKQGLGEGLFADWRYCDPAAREPNPDFVLNQPAYAGTSILLAGANFGCGSSREHAVWALAEYGIRAIIAPSFGAIFFQNCVRNGILPVVLDEAAVQAMADYVAADPAARRLRVDLEHTTVSAGALQHRFALAGEARAMLLQGLDPIALTLQQASAIETFEQQRRARLPWLFPGQRG
jgi:3-isopropylmalate/(R)-2-methylmalate dehydratase small subunit